MKNQIKNIIEIQINIFNKLEFFTTEIKFEDIEKKSFGRSAYIYIISGTLNNNHSLKDIKSNFEILKSKGLKLPIVNENMNKNILYIGTSSNIKQRLKKHLGNNNKSTYALSLGDWNKNEEYFSDIKITLYKFDIQYKNEIKLIEQKLHEKVKPLFGNNVIR